MWPSLCRSRTRRFPDGLQRHHTLCLTHRTGCSCSTVPCWSRRLRSRSLCSGRSWQTGWSARRGRISSRRRRSPAAGACRCHGCRPCRRQARASLSSWGRDPLPGIPWSVCRPGCISYTSCLCRSRGQGSRCGWRCAAHLRPPWAVLRRRWSQMPAGCSRRPDDGRSARGWPHPWGRWWPASGWCRRACLPCDWCVLSVRIWSLYRSLLL